MKNVCIQFEKSSKIHHQFSGNLIKKQRSKNARNIKHHQYLIRKEEFIRTGVEITFRWRFVKQEDEI